MRDLATIDAEISATAERLAALRGEREDVRQARDRVILALFDAGKSPLEISQLQSVPHGRVRNILSQHGKTLRGRQAVRAYQASLGAHQAGERT